MRRIRTTPAAREDLSELWRFIAADREGAADKMVRKINSKFDLLASFPGAGTNRSDLGPGIRSFPVRPYLIFFRATADELEVVRVLHGARNISQMDFR